MISAQISPHCNFSVPIKTFLNEFIERKQFPLLIRVFLHLFLRLFFSLSLSVSHEEQIFQTRKLSDSAKKNFFFFFSSFFLGDNRDCVTNADVWNFCKTRNLRLQKFKKNIVLLNIFWGGFSKHGNKLWELFEYLSQTPVMTIKRAVKKMRVLSLW